MPFINTVTNKNISKETEIKLKSQFGEAIKILGKSENWLMLNFTQSDSMYFQGESNPMAMLEVKLFGKASSSAYDNMTAKLTDIVSKELNISPTQIYIKYEECSHWGWNGNNF